MTGRIKRILSFLQGEEMIFFIMSNRFLLVEYEKEFERGITGTLNIWLRRTALYTAGSGARCNAASSARYSWFCLIKPVYIHAKGLAH